MQGISWKREIRILATCLFIAAMLWMFTALSANYTSQINLEVNYDNLPDDKVFSKALPNDLRLIVNGKGWELLYYGLTRIKPSVDIDFSQYQRRNFILTSRLRDEIKSQLQGSMVVLDVFPDTIPILTEPSLTRRLPISPNTKLNFAAHHALGGSIRVSPDSVTVTGPRSLVRGLKSIRTQLIERTDMKKAETVSAKFIIPGSNVRISPSMAELEIPVFPLTEDYREVDVEVVNSPIVGLQIIPQRVKVTYQVAVNKFDQVDQALFKAIVNGQEADTAGTGQLKVTIVSRPEGTYNLRIEPETVSFLLK